MEQPIASSDLTPEQNDTAELLRLLLGDTVADRFVDFCRLSVGTLPLRVSRPIAAHALRELDSLLRQVLAVPMDAKVPNDPSDVERQEKAVEAVRAHGYDERSLQNVRKALQPALSHAAQIKKIVSRLGLTPDGDIARRWTSITKASGRRTKGRSMRVLWSMKSFARTT